MSDTDTQEKEPKKKLSLARPGKLEIKKTIEGGQFPLDGGAGAVADG